MKRGSVKNRLLDRYVGIPVLFAMSLLKRKRLRPTTVERIGVMASSTLGDTLLNSAAVVDLRRHFPNARILYMSSSTGAAAVRLLPCVDEIVRIDITSPWTTIRAIRRCKLDVFLDFGPWQRLTAFYSATSGAKYTVGFNSPGQFRHRNYDLTAPHSRDCHEIENFRQLLRAFGVTAQAKPSLNLAKPHIDDSESRRRIVFHPWASGERAWIREWPEDRWVQLAQSLENGVPWITITGGPADVDRCAALRGKLLAAGIDADVHCGSSGLQSVAALLQSAALLISVNTGIMHLGAILGTPTVSLNGPTATHRWGPVGDRVASVKPKSGGGFLHFGFEYAGNPTDSMEKISVEDVLEGVRSIAPSLAGEASNVLQEVT